MWLVHGDRRMLWLPPDVRPDRKAAAHFKCLFVLGNSSGKMTFIEVDPSVSPPERVPLRTIDHGTGSHQTVDTANAHFLSFSEDSKDSIQEIGPAVE